MKINVTLPFDKFNGEDFLDHDAVKTIAQVSERAGFYSALVTDHPAPTGRWLDAGGHHAPDPFVLLSFLAAATTRIRIQTGILVLPYRNPFITARSVATLDVISGGRVSLGIGAGYLKGEYRALGVPFDTRNELTDEYIRALKAAWTNEEFTFEGTGYQALGNRILPLPIQKPHPPILVGGNSRRAIRRAAELGDAWNPVFIPTAVANTSRTADFKTVDDLAAGIAYLRQHCEAIGRETPPEVVLGSFNSPGEKASPAELVDLAGRFVEMGVTTVAAYIDGDASEAWCDHAERFGAEVIAKL